MDTILNIQPTQHFLDLPTNIEVTRVGIAWLFTQSHVSITTLVSHMIM
jgi:hypothetical protein